ncbi:MAG: arginine--tRNA ligase [Planctomycetaceae bacterium]|nr:arginine--tRNA ligase [Planctomycetaceae bacterium]
MSILATLRERFRPVLLSLVDSVDDLLEMIRPAQDARFGDYQANLAMPLAKQLRQSPQEVAQRIVDSLQVDDLCERPEVAGKGFINLRLRCDWLVARLEQAVRDERLGIPRVAAPRTIVVDYSSPNVAKAMHVGHIRSTVIGDAIYRTLQFVGHHVISDNHLGDWGTQFGMIIYGYKHFVAEPAYRAQPVRELGRLYKLVQQLIDYHAAVRELPERERQLGDQQAHVAAQRDAHQAHPQDKKLGKILRDAQQQVAETAAKCDELRGKIAAVEHDPQLAALAREHADIERAVLDQTARLHAGDLENLALWHEFLPLCKADMRRIYDRLGITFDHELGESFYHDRLAAVVQDLTARDLARTSDGAVCVFLPEYDTPMIIRKQDGAFLYATTDLATIQYRMEQWQPDEMLYVVDHRQGEHFGKLFATARLWGYDQVTLRHISFGTVLGEDGRPYRTRSGEVVGLEGLLDEAIRRAHAVVADNDDSKPGGPELSAEQRQEIAQTVGHAALKYADLSHNRTSDYVFSYDKMVALEGNTATYMQYSYARTQSIFQRGNVQVETLRTAGHRILLTQDAERDLALELVQFGDALDKSLEDYRPNVLTAYLFSLATKFSRFYQQCDVLRAESEAVRHSRLVLCDLTGRTIRQGLALLGIGVIDKM